MKAILSFIILVLSLIPVLAQSNISTQTMSDPNEFIGQYIYSSGFVGARYTISGNGKYEYSSFSDCCDPVWKETGTYDLKDNILHFKIIKHTLNQYNLLDPKEVTEAYRKLYDYKGKDIKADEIKTQYSLQIIKWGARIYLIDPDSLHLFTAAVNLGIEPRNQIISYNYLTTRFYLRRGDEDKIVSEKPTLPAFWNSYLHSSAIKATIAKIELQNQEKIYTVNKGSAQGLKVGMCFIEEKTEIDYENLLWVISVEEHSAKLKSFQLFRTPNYQTGNTLTTNPIKNPK